MTLSKKIIISVLLAVFAAGCVVWWIAAYKSPPENSTQISTPHSVAPANAMANAVSAHELPAHKVDSVDVMIEHLRARLEKEPSDVNGWVLLGRSYHYLERWEDAKAAFAKARALGYQGDAEIGAGSTPGSNEVAHAPNDGDAVFSDIGRVGTAHADTTPATQP